MYNCVNYLNKLLLFAKLGARARASIKKTKSRIESVSISGANVGFKLADWRVRELKSVLEELKLLNQVNFLDSFLVYF